MRYAQFEELNTPRLHLRKIRMEDASAYYTHLGSSADVTKYMLFQPHQDISDAVSSIEKNLRRYETGRNYRWVIAKKETDELMGVIDLLGFNEEESRCSFAYMLGKSFWDRGYGTEALEAVFTFAFEKMEMKRIEADHFAGNAASGAVMRKVGMVCTGSVSRKYEKDGIFHDAPQYVITRQQWLTR